MALDWALKTCEKRQDVIRSLTIMADNSDSTSGAASNAKSAYLAKVAKANEPKVRTTEAVSLVSHPLSDLISPVGQEGACLDSSCGRQVPNSNAIQSWWRSSSEEEHCGPSLKRSMLAV